MGILHAQVKSTPVEVHGKLEVKMVNNRAKVVDKNGEPVSFAGNSFFWSNTYWGAEPFYKKKVVQYLQDQWNSAIVRVAMGVEDDGGYLTHPAENKARMKTIVDAATDLGMYVIIDWHSHHAEDEEQAAVTFFEEMATTYKDHDNVIFEIYNEPLDVDWSTTIKPYAVKVIDAIRAKGADNLIVVGTPNWSQDVDMAADDPIAGEDIAYTIHFYAGTHGAALRTKCTTAMQNGIALFCTEWGTVDADGDGDVNVANTNTWITFLKNNDISHLNWAVNGKEEGASTFTSNTNAANALSDANLTESGLFVKNIILGWGEGNGVAVIKSPWSTHSPSPNANGISFAYDYLGGGTDWFNLNIVLTNHGTSLIDGYTLGFEAPWTAQEFWNDVPGTESGGVFTVPVFDIDGFSSIPVGGSVSIGLTANGVWSEPTNITWNGEVIESSGVSYDAWKTMYSVSDKEADDDMDGFSNLIEFFSGTLPNNGKSIPTIKTSVAQVGAVGDQYFMMEFKANPNVAGVEYRLQVTKDLSGWAALAGDGGMEFYDTTEMPDGMLKVRWKSVNTTDEMEKTFFTRLELR